MQIKIKGTTMTIEPELLQASRIIDSKMIVLKVKLDGTIRDLGAKVNNIAKLDNEMFILLSNV